MLKIGSNQRCEQRDGEGASTWKSAPKNDKSGTP